MEDLSLEILSDGIRNWRGGAEEESSRRGRVC